MGFEEGKSNWSQVPNILVVDDEESIRFSLQRFLTDAGFHVTLASHAAEARQILSRLSFDVAVVDRILPDGQDGVGLVEHIKGAQPFCQTILISAYPSFESAAKSMQCEVFAYLAKPVKRDEICRAVREAASKGRLRRERETRDNSLETQLFQASAMEAIGQLAGGIAHDFRNLLHVIGGNVELLMKDKKEDQPEYRTLKQIEFVCHKGKQLVRQLLDLCRSQDLHLEVVDLSTMLQKNEAFLREAIPEDIEVEMRLSENLAPVQVDPFQIEQCILNILINARDAIADKESCAKDEGNKEKPKIILATEDVILNEHHSHHYSWVKPGRHLLLSVSDTGIGMDEDVRRRIFDPLFTTKAMGKGTGLGLSTAYKIVKNHRGVIEVDSRPSKGTTFRIFLPAAEIDPSAVETPPASVLVAK